MASIKIIENGPYMVKNLEKLTDAEGNEIEVKKSIALCRCGESKNKPFCDGSHKDAGFEG